MKLVAWVLEPDTVEEIFKQSHGIGVGAEMIAVKMDDTTGLISCVFEVSDDVFSSLASNSRFVKTDIGENFN